MDLVHSHCEKKHDKLIDGGYLYLVDKKKMKRSSIDPEMCYWRCEMYRRDLKCLARVHTKNGQIVKKLGIHRHKPNFARVEALRVVEEIREKALTSIGRTREVIASSVANLPPEVVALLPTMSSLRRQVQRERMRASKELLPLPAFPSQSQSQCEVDSEELEELEKDVNPTNLPCVEPQFSQSQTVSSDSSQTNPGSSGSSPADVSLEVWRDEEVQNTVTLFEENQHAVQGPILEIHTSKMTTPGMWTYKEITQRVDYITTREAFTDTVLGHWTTAGHRVNQVTQLIQYDSMDHMLQVQEDMEKSIHWREQCRSLDNSLLSAHSVLTVLAPGTELRCQFETAEKAVYEMQTLPEQTCPVVLGSEAILVGRFHPLYGPSKTEYCLLRYPSSETAFAAAYHSMQALPSGSERRLLVPLPSSMLH